MFGVKCKHCGAEITEGAAFCGTCGSRLRMSGARLGMYGCLALFILPVIVAIAFMRDIDSTSTRPKAQVPINPKQEAMSQVKLDFTWSTDELGSLMFANFSIENNSSYTVKDIEITCIHSGKSGTTIDRNTRTIYDVVKAHSKKRFQRFNMGFIHSQVASSGCRIDDLELVD